MDASARHRSTWREFFNAVALERFAVAMVSCLSLGLLTGALLTSSGADQRAVFLGIASSLILMLLTFLLARTAVGHAEWQGEITAVRRLETDLQRLQLDLERCTAVVKSRSRAHREVEKTDELDFAVAYLRHRYNVGAEESQRERDAWYTSPSDERIAMKLEVGRVLASVATEAVNEAIEETSARDEPAEDEPERQEGARPGA